MIVVTAMMQTTDGNYKEKARAGFNWTRYGSVLGKKKIEFVIYKRQAKSMFFCYASCYYYYVECDCQVRSLHQM